jgi:hypothetical protein
MPDVNGIIIPPKFVVAPNDRVFMTFTQPGKVRDGLSTTFLMFEKRQSLEELERGTQTAGNAVGWIAGLPGCDPRIVRGGDTLRQPVADWGRNLLRSPGSGPRLIDSAVGSSHPAGVVCGFCDGSVRLLPFDTDIEVRSALSTRAGAERIDPVAFEFAGFL